MNLRLIDKVFGIELSSLSKVAIRPIVSAIRDVASITKYYYEKRTKILWRDTIVI